MVLTGHLPDRDSAGQRRPAPDWRAWRADLTAARVPRPVREALSKALREDDPRSAAGKERYARARDVARDLEGWIVGRRRRARLVRSTALVLFLAVPLVWLAAEGWSRYERERASGAQRQVEALVHELEQRPNRAHPAVQRLEAEARAARTEHDRRFAAGDLAGARGARLVALDAFRRALGASHEVEVAEPLLQTLGEVLVYTPWARTAPSIATRQDELVRRYRELGQLLDGGDLLAAGSGMRQLQRDLAQLAADNADAMRAELARLDYQRLARGVSLRLTGLDGFRAAAARAEEAQRLLDVGQFTDRQGPGAISEYGQARVQLERLLAQEELPEERFARIEVDAEMVKDFEERTTAIALELEAALRGVEAEREKHGATRTTLEQTEAARTALLTEREAWLRDRPEFQTRIRALEADLIVERAAREQSEGDAADWRRAAETRAPQAAELVRAAAAERQAEELRTAYVREEAPAELDRLANQLADLGPGSRPPEEGNDQLARARGVRDALIERLQVELGEFLPTAPALEPYRAALARVDLLTVDILEARCARLAAQIRALDPPEGAAPADAAFDLAVELVRLAEVEQLSLGRPDLNKEAAPHFIHSPASQRMEDLSRLSREVLVAAGRALDQAALAGAQRAAVEIEALRAERRDLLEKEGRRRDSSGVRDVDAALEAIEALLSKHRAAVLRARGELPPRSAEVLLALDSSPTPSAAASTTELEGPAAARLSLPRGPGTPDPGNVGNSRRNPTPRMPAWAEIIEAPPDPRIVVEAEGRARMEATGLPWKVRDRGTGVVLLLVPPGEYVRGTSPGDNEAFSSEAFSHERPPHRVRIAEPFYLGQFPVTQEEFHRMTGLKVNSQQENPTAPVTNVSFDILVDVLQAKGLRLPRESEWEYACRAGTSEARYGPLDDIAWTHANSGRRPQPVGRKRANGWGFHDMLGNVNEWCATWYHPGFYGELASRPQPVDADADDEATGQLRVARGGNWGVGPEFARSSSRGADAPFRGNAYYGLRVARTP